MGWKAGHFVGTLAVALSLGSAGVAFGGIKIIDDGLHLVSPYLDLRVSLERPGFLALAVDGLGEGKPGPNALRPPAGNDAYRASHGARDGRVWVEYRRRGSPAEAPPGWQFEIGDRDLRLISRWSPAGNPAPLLLDFDPERCHVSLLGLMNDSRSVRLPAVLHLPNQGSLRITTTDRGPVSLACDAGRSWDSAAANFVKVAFPAATQSQPRLEYRCEVTAIYPPLGKREKAPELCGFHRNWLNVFQLDPRRRMLANNTTSDVCAFCLYEYADMAVYTPPLADRLTALDLVRQTLDQYLSGVLGYGLPNYRGLDKGSWTVKNPPLADTYPSLLISVADYVQGSGDAAWLKRNYPGVRKWADALLATDRDGDGLFKYAFSGNWYALRDNQTDNLPANWWDAINYGHEDAYSNALAYRALGQMAAAAETIGQRGDAARWRAAAQKLRAAYFRTFFDPATGVLAGWRSADGQLHDYYFLYVSGIAVDYGLVPRDQAGPIMDRLTAKMKEVGFNRFDLGLPGNLVAVPLKDYRWHEKARVGGGEKADGSEGFQHFENGGATACFAQFTISALYDAGRRKQADEILLPLLAALDRNDFEGRDFLKAGKEWKSWDGAAFGYEGYLTDNYYALLSVLAREGLLRKWP